MGQDWRSPGEVWIKTIEGWEPMKLLRKSHFQRHQNDPQQQQSTRQQQEDEISKRKTNETDENCDSNLNSQETNVLMDDIVVSSSLPKDYHRSSRRVRMVLPSSSSSSLSSSSLDANNTGNSSSSGDSDSDEPSSFVINSNSTSDPVPVPKTNKNGSVGLKLKEKTRHISGDSIGSAASLTSAMSTGSESMSSSPESSPTVADIIQKLQRSSSQPIPIDILKESSEQIEIYHTQPYYPITLNPTREVQGSNIISDAFYKLDFCNAIRDIRRFAYVSKLLHLLIRQNLTSLSGNATKALFWMLEEIAKQVASNKQNIHVIRELLVELREIVDKYLCWGRPLGSSQLWEQHLRTMERICDMTDAIEIVPPDNNGKPSWSELPEELIREILLRLSDYKDLERSAQACQRMNCLLNEEQHIWKQLVKYHFTKDQQRWALRMYEQQQQQQQTQSSHANRSKIMNQTKMMMAGKVTPTSTTNTNNNKKQNSLLDEYLCDDENNNNNNNNGKPQMDWEQLFHLLRKKFGLKEEYADCLFLCRYCRCLFWKSKNHPCILENPDLTRQVLVTSPLTGYTSQTSNTPPGNFAKITQNVLQQLQNRSRSFAGPIARQSSSPASASAAAAATASSLPPPQASSNVLRRRPLQQQQLNHPVIQPQPLPGGPVIVQNIPFFEHPLVIQRMNNNNNGDGDENRNDHNNNNNGSSGSSSSTFQKAPLHVPITPQAFLKFFSL